MFGDWECGVGFWCWFGGGWKRSLLVGLVWRLVLGGGWQCCSWGFGADVDAAVCLIGLCVAGNGVDSAGSVEWQVH